jgi:hypothetical protein
LTVDKITELLLLLLLLLKYGNTGCVIHRPAQNLVPKA